MRLLSYPFNRQSGPETYINNQRNANFTNKESSKLKAHSSKGKEAQN
jgi:hypothetical protein